MNTNTPQPPNVQQQRVVRSGVHPAWIIAAIIGLFAACALAFGLLFALSEDLSFRSLGNSFMREGEMATVPATNATAEPTAQPTAQPTAEPTAMPTAQPTAEPTAMPTAQPTAEPTAMPTAQPTAEPTEKDELKPVPAGADFFAITWQEIVTDTEGFVAEGRYRLVEPTNSRQDSPEYCAWSTQWVITTDPALFKDGPLQMQWPHCLELRATGTGEFMVEVWPDESGYDTSDLTGMGLALWPSGNDGNYIVSIDGGKTWTEEIPLTTGPEGVNLPKSWNEEYGILIFFTLDDGFMTMPVGEIRNQVIPVYGPAYDPRD